MIIQTISFLQPQPRKQLLPCWIGINEFIMDHSANLAENTNNEPYEDVAGAFSMYN
ncbi:MAG: hypothetical protein IPI54_07580 [Chitinophagaceae bacterium]|nr:hypothetical protein [Chitinophagaceae bacterium]